MGKGQPLIKLYRPVKQEVKVFQQVVPDTPFTRIYDECTFFDKELWTYEEHPPTSDGNQLIFTVPADTPNYIVKLLSRRLMGYGDYRVRLRVDPKDPNIWFYVFLYYRRGAELYASHNELDVEFIGGRPSDEVQIALYPDGEMKVYGGLKLPGPIDDGNWHILDLRYRPDLVTLSVDGVHVKTITENIPRPPMFFLVGCESKTRGPASDWHMYVNLIDIYARIYGLPVYKTAKIQRAGVLASGVTEQLIYLPNCEGALQFLTITTNTAHLELRITVDGHKVLVPFSDGTDLAYITPAMLNLISGLAPLSPVNLAFYDEVADRYALTLNRALNFKRSLLVEIRQETGVDKNVGAFGYAFYRRLP